MRRIAALLGLLLLLALPHIGQAAEADIYCQNGTPPPNNVPCGIPTNPVVVTQSPSTTGGLSTVRTLVANNTTSIAIKATPGQIYHLDAFNNGSTIAYLKLYNLAQGSNTCGSNTPIWEGMIPASSGFIEDFANGITFSAAISACVTTGFADNDTSAPAATTYMWDAGYK